MSLRSFICITTCKFPPVTLVTNSLSSLSHLPVCCVSRCQVLLLTHFFTSLPHFIPGLTLLYLPFSFQVDIRQLNLPSPMCNVCMCVAFQVLLYVLSGIATVTAAVLLRLCYCDCVTAAVLLPPCYCRCFTAAVLLPLCYCRCSLLRYFLLAICATLWQLFCKCTVL